MKRILLLASLILFSNFINTYAEEQVRELPKSGLLAGSGSGAFGGTEIDGVWGDDSIDGKESSAPIGGSVSNLGKGNWLARVTNSSEDKYRVSVVVEQFSNANKKLKSTPMTLTLKAGETVERKIKASQSTAHCKLQLRNWKKYEKKKSSEELNAEISKKEEELRALKEQLSPTK